MRIWTLVLRLLIGGLFAGHGTQKLFGWFGGNGLDATGEAFESMGLEHGREQATLAGISEAGGGALLAAGLLTPLAATALTGTMAQAIRTVHAPKGPWATAGGWEYNAVLIAALIAIVDTGPGAGSADEHWGLKLSGTGWALAALVAGLAGPEVVQRVAASRAAPEPQVAPG